MSGPLVWPGREGSDVGCSVPIFLYCDLKFGSYYVAEPDTTRPAHFARLLSLLMRNGRSREDAEDLIQEAMLRLHLYAKSEVVLNQEAFLIHAVRNLAIDRHRHDRSIEGREVHIDEVDRLHPLIAQSPGPDHVVDNQQRLSQITALLDSIGRRTREVYIAHRSGYTHAEIANDMSIAEITVQRHITRAHLAITKHEEAEPRCLPNAAMAPGKSRGRPGRRKK